MVRNFVKVWLAVLMVLVMAVAAEASGATGAGASGMPWESALTTLANSLTGPVAYAFGLFMIVCGFCAIAFTGADMGGWVRWIAMAAVLAGMLGGAPIVLNLFGLSQALVL